MVLSISIGLVVGSIAGALLAVPLLAVLNAGVRSLIHERDPHPEDVDALHDKNVPAAEPEPEPKPEPVWGQPPVGGVGAEPPRDEEATESK